MFRTGQKVACVNGTYCEWFFEEAAQCGVKLPELGQVYTIREFATFEDLHGVRLIELRNPRLWCGNGHYEPLFDPRRFRPLVDEKIETDISMLQKMVADQFAKRVKYEG